jgi:hypothetical protein
MNYQKAIDILEIDINNVDFKSSSTSYLKRCYHKQALKYHPDKNGNTTESTERFKLINDAYDFLKREDEILNNDNINNTKETDENSSVYKDILQLFLKGILDGKYSESISSIIKEIILNFSEVKKMTSLKMFDGLDKETTINIYNFLSKYRSLFHFSNEFLDKIKDIIIKKHDDIMVYVLNPSIDDLLNNNVYKLYVEEELYLVPLWHSEMYFDVKKRETETKETNETKETHDIKEIIVLCYPELPENITIDEDNNLYVEVNLNVSDISPFLSSSKNMKVFLGKKELDIPLYNLYIRDTQLYRIKSQGLTKIKENDIYDISEKCDIIVKINMTL